MGNALAQEFRERYAAGEFEEVLAHSDAQLGSYRLIKFSQPRAAFCLVKTLNPADFDHYCSDIDEFAKKLTRGHAHVCEFLFVEPSARDLALYDLVFEFGDFINTAFRNEQVIWTFVEHVLAALQFLEAEGLHYPALRKKFTVYCSARSAFKLLNPNCFAAHLDAVIGVYLNPQRAVSEKKAFHDQHVTRNVKELGVTVLALVTGREEAEYFRNPALIRPAVAELRAGGHSPKLVNFLLFTIEGRGQVAFADVKAFLAAEVGALSDEQFRQACLSNSIPVLCTAGESPAEQRRRALRLKSSLPAGSVGLGAAAQVDGVGRAVAAARAAKFSTPHAAPAAPAKPSSAVDAAALPPPPPRKLKRITLRWCKETNRHREFAEYHDGSVEERVSVGEEAKPTAPQPTPAAQPTPAPQSQSTWNIVLFSEELGPGGRVILSADMRESFERYDFMTGVVDSTHALRPSLYHSPDAGHPLAAADHRVNSQF